MGWLVGGVHTPHGWVLECWNLGMTLVKTGEWKWMGRDGKVKLPKQCRFLACVHLRWHFKAGI